MTPLSIGSLAVLNSPDEIAAFCLNLLDMAAPRTAAKERAKKRVSLAVLMADLNRLTPFCTYFGHLPSDHAHYGVWIDLDALHAAEQSGVVSQVSGGDWRGVKSPYVLDIGKDGLTLYRRRGRKVVWTMK